MEAGSGSPGAASSLLSRPRGAVDSGLAAVLAAVESVAVSVRVCVFGFGWMVVRFVRVIRLPACARVSRVSRVRPGSPRCLFTRVRGEPGRTRDTHARDTRDTRAHGSHVTNPVQ